MLISYLRLAAIPRAFEDVNRRWERNGSGKGYMYCETAQLLPSAFPTEQTQRGSCNTVGVLFVQWMPAQCLLLVVRFYSERRGLLSRDYERVLIVSERKEGQRRSVQLGS